MATTNRVTPSNSASTSIPRRRHFFVSGIAVRMLIALIISWLIIMAFFVTRVASH